MHGPSHIAFVLHSKVGRTQGMAQPRRFSLSLTDTLLNIPSAEATALLEEYENATAMKANAKKFEGIRCGTLRNKPVPGGVPVGPLGRGYNLQFFVFFCSPAPSRVAVAWSFYKQVPNRASSNQHIIAAMRVASRVAPQCFCLRVRACEYHASNCELQVGLGVV